MRIWFDTEFVDTGNIVHLLSIGMIREDGRTYYAEPAETDRSLSCEWVAKNVIPHMQGPILPRQKIREDIVAFAGARPEFWAYYATYDWLCLSQLFGRMLDVPAHWPHFVMDIQQLRTMMGVRDLPKQEGTEHNALDDAIWNKRVWEFLIKVGQ